ncbi:MAG: helix-turn-helix domain-containing protein [Burkholderiaceae bacterium]
MNFFSDALSRLKHQLRVSKDQEVAALLGLSKTAFSERKKRGSFPEREVLELAKKRPDLDAGYVLTGIDASAKIRLDEKQARLGADVEDGMDYSQARANELARDTTSIEAITELLTHCRLSEREAIYQLLSSLVGMRKTLATAIGNKNEPPQ